MVHLRVYAPPAAVPGLLTRLRRAEVRHVVLSGHTADTGLELVTAELEPDATDTILDALVALGLDPDDITISRVETASPAATRDTPAPRRDRDDALVWTEVSDEAVENVGLRPTYLAYMAVAGVIAAFGVVEHSAVLIVGAMAVSPDLLPLTAACVALVARRPKLLARAVGALVPGLATGIFAAFLVTLALTGLGIVPRSIDIGHGVIGGLATVGEATVGVALAAGVAGMLSFESRANFAVGVAISVTTIPAAAYMGVAAGLGRWHAASGALAVLTVNLTMLILAGTTTLAVQRALARRHNGRTSQR